MRKEGLCFAMEDSPNPPSQLALDARRLDFEREKFTEEKELERFRIKWISGAVTIAIAVISAASGVTVAVIEYFSNNAQILHQKERGKAEDKHRSAEQERLFLETFAAHVMRGDLSYRWDFAFYAKTVSRDPETKGAWEEYLLAIGKQIGTTEAQRNKIRSEIAHQQIKGKDEQDTLKIAALQRENDRLTRLLEGGADIRTPSQSALTVEYMRDYLQFFKSLRLKHFTGPEFLVLGAAHSNPGSGAYGLNAPPPPEIWPNIADVAKVMDEFRERHGAPVEILAAFRTKRYAMALVTSSRSFHLTGQAVKFKSSKGTPQDWAALLRSMRDEGLFKGGVGVYSTFVHVDTRGQNTDWSYH